MSARDPGSPRVEETLDLIVTTARASLPDFDQVGVWTFDEGGSLATVAAAGDLVLELDRLQLSFDEGPCLDALRVVPLVVVPDLGLDRRRWTRYVPHALDLGVRSQLSVRLSARGDRVVGGLNVYSTESREVAPQVVDLVRQFAAQAASALERAREAEGLQAALESRTVISQAVGLLMAQYVLSAEAAFAYLVRTSSRSNVKLRDIAATLVDEAEARAQARGPQDPVA